MKAIFNFYARNERRLNGIALGMGATVMAAAYIRGVDLGTLNLPLLSAMTLNVRNMLVAAPRPNKRHSTRPFSRPAP